MNDLQRKNSNQENDDQTYVSKESLQEALDQEQFELFYQPKLCLTTGVVTGVEALIRWKHPVHGYISPVQFIPLAEETGLIIPIGNWVIREACMQNKTWQQQGLPPFVMSVNLSVRQLYHPDLVSVVRNILLETKLQPSLLELEITESMLMDTNKGYVALHELKSLGISLSLDDFGTGYSSLYYLKEFPIDKLKIDQSFVKNSTKNSNDATIVKTIIAMAHQLKLEVVAEGIEEPGHLAFLQRNLCNEGQGYLFSQPLPKEQFVEQFHEMGTLIEKLGLQQENNSNHIWLEEALQVARQELLDLVKQQQGLIFKYIRTCGGKFIHTICDGELLHRFGLQPEKIIGFELSDFLPDHSAQDKLVYYQRAWDGEEQVVYEQCVKGIWYVASLRPIFRNGKVVEVVGSCVDITERKRMEEQLRRSDEYLRLITHHISDLVGIWDTAGKVIYSSLSHSSVLGYSPETLVGMDGFDLIHPEDLPSVREKYAKMLADKQTFQVRIRAQRVNKQWISFETKISPVLGFNGSIEGVVVVGRPIEGV